MRASGEISFTLSSLFLLSGQTGNCLETGKLSRNRKKQKCLETEEHEKCLETGGNKKVSRNGTKNSKCLETGERKKYIQEIGKMHDS